MGGAITLASANMGSVPVDDLSAVDSFFSSYDPEAKVLVTASIFSRTDCPMVMSLQSLHLPGVDPNDMPVDDLRLSVIRSLKRRYAHN